MRSDLYDEPGSPELGDDAAGGLGYRSDDGRDVLSRR